MSKKKKQQPYPTRPTVPKWIENSQEPRSPQEIRAAINARLAFRALRRALGLTQPEMAQKLGVSLAAVQGAESGWRPVSREMARLVQAKFGVFASSVTGFTSEPATLLREKVTPESVQRVFQNIPPVISKEEIAPFTKPLADLVQAAASEGCLRVFAATFDDMLSELKRALCLDDALGAILRSKNSPQVVKKITRRDLREIPEVAASLAKLGIVDDPSIPDDEVVIMTVPPKQKTEPWMPPSQYRPSWNDLYDKDGTINWADHSGSSTE